MHWCTRHKSTKSLEALLTHCTPRELNVCVRHIRASVTCFALMPMQDYGEGLTALHWAVVANQVAHVRMLARAGANSACPDSQVRL